ncbi:MAG: nucleotide exchange factor GrpE [Pseudomonadales bacterium]
MDGDEDSKLVPINDNQKNATVDHESPDTNSQQLPEPAAAGDNQIAPQLKLFQESVELSISKLVTLVESRLASDAVKEKAFDRLYAELEEAKQDREFEQFRPFFTDLILLFDRLEHLSNEPLETQESSSIVVSIRDELLEILSRRRVDLIPPNEHFDPAFQNALGVEGTNDEAENNRIARVVRRGFRYNSRVIRHEEVFVYRFASSEMDPAIEETKCQSHAHADPLAAEQQGSEHD